MQCIVVLLNEPMYTTLSTIKQSELYLVIVDSPHVVVISYIPNQRYAQKNTTQDVSVLDQQ